MNYYNNPYSMQELQNMRDTYNEDLDMVVDELRYLYRKIEDVSEMATNAQEKSTLMKVSQSTKEGYQNLKSLMHKSM